MSQNERPEDVQKMFKTSCEHLMYVPFTFSIQGSIDILMILETKKNLRTAACNSHNDYPEI